MSYNEETILPFWAENSGFITGRDPLGIQNSSIAVYSKLLPGMTNLTQRIRYYSFYCWLLTKYDKLEIKSEKKTFYHQYNFIRRSELIIAFLMVNKFANVTSVVGSDYATKHKGDVDNKKFYNIKDGADKFTATPKDDLYWNYLSGALGQYYAGALINFDLIEIIDSFFLIKERGRELAAAFGTGISIESQDCFIEAAQKGKIDLQDLETIQPFNLNAIPEEGEEWLFLKDILLGDDGENYKTRKGTIPSNRRESIYLYLTFLSQKTSDIKFDQWVFNNLSDRKEINTALFGWYYYYINEAFHYALETIFWAFLENLDGRIILLPNYLREFINHILEENSNNLGIDQNDSLLSVLNLNVNTDLEVKLKELEKITTSSANWKTALGKATELLMVIYKTTEPFHKKIQEFENYYSLNYQKGIITEYLALYIKTHQELSYAKHIEKTIKRLINDHIATAYRKMGNGELNLLKFIIEDNVITRIQSMSPRHTTPRINSLRNFLQDLGYLDKDESLTDRGTEFLNELTAEQ
jgi:hypothetical protein